MMNSAVDSLPSTTYLTRKTNRVTDVDWNQIRRGVRNSNASASEGHLLRMVTLIVQRIALRQRNASRQYMTGRSECTKTYLAINSGFTSKHVGMGSIENRPG